MGYQDHIDCMKALADTFDSIGYAGIGRQGGGRCIAAFEAGDKDRAIMEYRKAIGAAANFGSALTDLETEAFSTEIQGKYLSQMLAVMFGMSLLMKGHEK